MSDAVKSLARGVACPPGTRTQTYAWVIGDSSANGTSDCLGFNNPTIGSQGATIAFLVAPQSVINAQPIPLACAGRNRRRVGDDERLSAGGAEGWVGAPFAGRGSHPLDDEPNFMTSSQPHSFRTSLAWSHWKSLLAARTPPLMFRSPRTPRRPSPRRLSSIAFGEYRCCCAFSRCLFSVLRVRRASGSSRLFAPRVGVPLGGALLEHRNRLALRGPHPPRRRALDMAARRAGLRRSRVRRRARRQVAALGPPLTFEDRGDGAGIDATQTDVGRRGTYPDPTAAAHRPSERQIMSQAAESHRIPGVRCASMPASFTLMRRTARGVRSRSTM